MTNRAGGLVVIDGGTFHGVLAGTGDVEFSIGYAASSTTTLTGVSTYTGATTIDAGATLSLGASASIANTSAITDNGALQIAGVFDLTDGSVIAGSGTIDNAGTVDKTGTGTTTIQPAVTNELSGFIDVQGGSVTFSGGLTNIGVIEGVISTSGGSTTVTADAGDTVHLTGGSGDNAITGTASNDVIDGGTGVDTLAGGGGNDVYFVDNAADQVSEAAGGGADLVWTSVSYALAAGQEVEKLYALSPGGTAAINLSGNVYFNTLAGTAGVNVLNGGYGADVMIGFAGNDTYYVDNAADQVIEAVGGGTDLVRASVSYMLAAGQEIESLTTTNNAGTDAINLTGNSFANTIYGNAGANLIDGKGGADIMAGLGGNDIYYVDNAADHVFEAAGGGSDLVWTSVSYALAAGQEVEKLYALSPNGTAAINLTGNEFSNTLAGTAGANILNGGGGADIMIGGAGNDTYYVDNGADQVIEATGGGADVVRTSVSFALTAGQEIETLITTNNAGTGAINLTGNASSNTIYGNAGANVLNGGLGADTLVGFAGHDTFVFNTALGGGNIDHVYDFAPSTAADPDTIQLAHAVFAALPTGTLADAAFTDIASTVETASSRILYDHTTGALSYDPDGAGGAAAVQFAVLDNHAALSHGDFFVV